MRFLHAIIIPAFAALTITACTMNAADDASQSNSAVTSPDGERAPAMRPGPAMLLFAALHEEIGLADTQRTTIKGLVDGLKPPPPPPIDRTKLAAQIRAGAIDLEALKPETAPPAPDFTALASALRTLHSTLTSEQRTALVAAIKARAAEPPPPPPPSKLFADLGLTDAQKAAIKSAMEANKPPPPPSDVAARLDSFATDTFDATAFVTPPTDAPKMEDPMLRELAIVVPILTVEQREKLAAKI
jgi:hypothetical protein